MPDTAKIRALNDAFRRSFSGGQVLVTPGVLNRHDMEDILERVRTFDNFNEDCDPHKEHDFISFLAADGQQIFAKVDYYNLDLTGGSLNPADENLTSRVLTILLSEDY